MSGQRVLCQKRVMALPSPHNDKEDDKEPEPGSKI